MTTTGVEPARLRALTRWGAAGLAGLARDGAAARHALRDLRHGCDAHLLDLDPGLSAEAARLLEGWRALDDLLAATADALDRGDRGGALALRLHGLRARAAARTRVTAADLVRELGVADGATPRVVADWVTALSPGELALLERDAPDVLGRLDGVPLAVRDRANRRLVRQEVERLEDAVAADGWLDRHVGIPGVRDRLRDQHEADLRRITALQQLLAADLVLFFDPTGDGRAVAAFGDPTTARHVATVVPGIGNRLESLPATLDRATHLRAVARDRRDGPVATVAWLGYDTPGSLGADSHELLTEATRGARARTAADDLTRFLDGLATVRSGDRAHVTVVSHSYGSRVLGEALSRGGARIDEVVAVGSPGMGVDHVDDWDLPPTTTVWAESAGTHGWTWWFPGGGDDPVAHAPAHGRNPDDPAFGARGFDVGGASGHSSYFGHDAATGRPSMSLRSLGAIVVGHEPVPDPEDLDSALAAARTP